MKQLLSAGMAVGLIVAACARREALSAGPVTIVNEGARLAGTIYLPEHPQPPLAAAVLVHGSGRATRDNLRFMREQLLAMGVAVLAYDKRGVGESTGEYDNVGVRTSPERMPLLGRDALAALRVLEGRSGFDAKRLGFVGVSQAGWIIPSAIAGAKSGEVRFAVIQSGPAGSVGQEYAYSEATGDGIRPHEDLTTAEIDARVDAYTGPPGFDNMPALRVDRTPILWLLGEADESIPVRHTARHLLELTRDGVPISIRSYPGANHALFAPTGRVPFWDDVRDWLQRQEIIPQRRSRLPTPNSQLPTPNSQLPTPNFQLPTSNFQLPTSDFRLPTPGPRFPWELEVGSWELTTSVQSEERSADRTASDRTHRPRRAAGAALSWTP